MGITDLQTFIEETCKEACKSVDLIKIARGLALSQAGKKRGPNRLCLVVDGESCLDRLYGGYYSDWACGGQWNRMNQFLGTLIQACGSAHMELVVFFNGGLENQRLQEWFVEQQNVRKNASNVLKHINNKATPPPKVWWIPPVSLRSSLRMALRQYGVPVASSLEDHHQEVIQYLRENNFHGIVADEADYAVFDPPRYFSSQHLKLTYKGALETTEFVMDEVAKFLDLHPKRFSVVAALLGNHLLTEQDLEDFYFKICNVSEANELKKLKTNDVIKAVIEFVRLLQSVDELDSVGKDVFGSESDKITKFKHSVHYYMNGTPDHFGKFRKEIRAHIRLANSTNGAGITPIAAAIQKAKEAASKKSKGNEDWDGSGTKNKDEDLKTDIFKEHESGYAKSADGGVKIGGSQETEEIESGVKDLAINGKSDKKADVKKPQKQTEKGYKMSQDALKIARDRHHKGLLHPWVHQILSHNEVKIDSSLEDENNRDLPLAVELFRPVRQLVYSILFDYNKRLLIYRNAVKEGKEPVPEKPKVLVKEWLIPRGNYSKPRCEEVPAEELDWLVPGLHRLWLGQESVDKNRRLRAFLSCLNSDVPLMLNTSYIPQHLIVLCAVLRYMVLFKDQRVLRKHELDAFLATAVSPLLCDVDTMQEMKLPMLTSRGVQLGTIFMRGVEHAMFVNDACGAPVPWGMCCPWLFFDGKLFHFKLLKANNNTPLIDICDGQVDQVMRVERMRQAILQGVPLDLVFAKPPLPPMQNQYGGPPQPYGHGHGGMNMRPGGSQRPMSGPGGRGNGRGRGLMPGNGQVDQRGGQLQIAGVVVGNWGPNMQNTSSRPGGRGTHIAPPPQVTSVGPRRGGQRGVVSSPAARGRGYSRSAGYSTRGGGRGQFFNQVQRMNGGGRGGQYGGNRNFAGGDGQQQSFNPQNYGPLQYNSFGRNNMGGNDFNNYRGGRGGSSYGNGYGNRSDINRVTLAERTKQSSGGGRGRGCTVESQHEGGKIVSVSQMMKSENSYTGHSMPQPPVSVSQSQMIQAQMPQHMQPQGPQGGGNPSQQQMQPQSHVQQQQQMGHAGQLPPTQMSTAGHLAGPPPQVSMGPAGHMPAVSIHSGGPPQMTQMNLGQGHMNMGNISMGQAGQMAGITMGGQGQMPPVSLGGPPLLNGGGDFASTFQGMHHSDLGIGQNELNMIAGQVGDFPIMDSHIGVFESAD